MKTLLARLALILALTVPAALPLMLAQPALAVQPDEMLKNPKLEARAEEISKGLRCLVCRNENIDDSDAALAHDLRVLVRKRLVAGDTNQQVVNYIVARYGEYVLLKPDTRGANLILWAAAPGMLLLGLAIALYTQRRRRRSGEGGSGLSAEEEKRLAEIMRE